MANVQVNYFGSFRKFGDHITLSMNNSNSIQDIKSALIVHLGPQHKDLVDESAMANETDILPGDFLIKGDVVLSILPPVCGG